MSAVVLPLDPASPAGIAAAEALSQALAEIQVAVWRRTAASEPGTPDGHAPAVSAAA